MRKVKPTEDDNWDWNISQESKRHEKAVLALKLYLFVILVMFVVSRITHPGDMLAGLFYFQVLILALIALIIGRIFGLWR